LASSEAAGGGRPGNIFIDCVAFLIKKNNNSAAHISRHCHQSEQAS